jgi:hypothetical protein
MVKPLKGQPLDGCLDIISLEGDGACEVLFLVITTVCRSTMLPVKEPGKESSTTQAFELSQRLSAREACMSKCMYT